MKFYLAESSFLLLKMKAQFCGIRPLFKTLNLRNTHVYQRDTKMFTEALFVLQKMSGHIPVSYHCMCNRLP